MIQRNGNDMELNGYERTQIYMGVPFLILLIVTVFIFDSLLPFLFICLAAIFWLLAYLTREAFDTGERIRKPRWYGGNEGESEIAIEYSRYNIDGKYIDVLVGARKAVRIFPGDKVTVKYDPSSEIRVQPKVYDAFPLSLRESQTACYLYRQRSYRYVEDGAAVEPCLKQ